MADELPDDLDRQIGEYFSALAERAGPLPEGSVVAPSKKREGRSSGRTPMLVGVAVLVLAAIVIAFGAISTRSRPDKASPPEESSLPDPCESIPVALVPAQLGSTPEPIVPNEVVFFQRTTNGMSGWNEPMVVVGSNGTIVAVNDFVHPTVYNTATLTPGSLDGLRSCLTGSGFQSLDETYLNQEGGGSGPTFCALADASTDIFESGPAVGEPKSVSAYGLIQNTIAETGSSHKGCDLGRPPALVGLYQTSVEFRQLVNQSGVQTEPPSDELDPSPAN